MHFVRQTLDQSLNNIQTAEQVEVYNSPFSLASPDNFPPHLVCTATCRTAQQTCTTLSWGHYVLQHHICDLSSLRRTRPWSSISPTSTGSQKSDGGRSFPPTYTPSVHTMHSRIPLQSSSHSTVCGICPWNPDLHYTYQCIHQHVSAHAICTSGALCPSTLLQLPLVKIMFWRLTCP